MGDDLGGGFCKLRINIQSKCKGKRGGGRLITYEAILTIADKNIIFAVLYDKSEFESVDISFLKKMIENT